MHIEREEEARRLTAHAAKVPGKPLTLQAMDAGYGQRRNAKDAVVTIILIGKDDNYEILVSRTLLRELGATAHGLETLGAETLFAVLKEAGVSLLSRSSGRSLFLSFLLNSHRAGPPRGPRL